LCATLVVSTRGNHGTFCKSLALPGKSISRATINKELRCLRAWPREAAKRNYLSQALAITMLKEPKKLSTYVDEETLVKLDAACDAAEYPAE
jgi:hypothetical protein